MEPVMGGIAIAVLILCCIVGIVLVPLGLPGTFVIFAGALLYNLIHWSMAISLLMLSVVLGLALFGELLEYILSMKMARNRGASNPAVIGAIIGGIIGALVGTPVPVVGSIIGLFAGVFLGAFGAELLTRKDFKIALNSAIGAFYGRVGSILAKVLVGIVMMVVLFMDIF